MSVYKPHFSGAKPPVAFRLIIPMYKTSYIILAKEYYPILFFTLILFHFV
nr:MAG TPA: hypothetical protein [Caudoviricetes sp.]